MLTTISPNLFNVAVHLVLKIPAEVFIKKYFQSSFSKFCWKYLLVLIEHFEKSEQYGPISHFGCNDEYIYISVLLVDIYAMHLLLIHISHIYTHTHYYSNNTTYKSFQVIISGPSNPIHHCGPFETSNYKSLSSLRGTSATYFPEEKFTWNISVQANQKYTLSMLKKSRRTLLEKLRCPCWKRVVYSYQV